MAQSSIAKRLINSPGADFCITGRVKYSFLYGNNRCRIVFEDGVIFEKAIPSCRSEGIDSESFDKIRQGGEAQYVQSIILQIVEGYQEAIL